MIRPIGRRLARLPRMLSLGLPLYGLLLFLAASSGCGQQADTSSPTPEPAATAAPDTAAKPSNPMTKAVVVKVNAQGCAEYDPPNVVINRGGNVWWIADATLTASVDLHLPGGAFRDSNWVLAPNGAVNSGPSVMQDGKHHYKKQEKCANPIDDLTGPGVEVAGDKQ